MRAFFVDMPLPEPQPGETESDFNSRCMDDPVMVGDFPDEEQRFAVCQQQWADDEKAVPQKYDEIDFAPTDGMRTEAQRGLDWRDEFGRGGTAVGIARARDISNGENLSPDTWRRMKSFFARHEVNKEAEGFRPGEEGYPSNGRIAWALWGGDPGQSRSETIVAQMDRADERDKMSLAEQVKSHSRGIVTADRYFRSIETCFDGGFCPTRLFADATQEQWTKALKEAESKLTYSDDEMEFGEFRRKGPAGLTPGSIMDFDCIVTSTKKDRDGDILESKGAIVDERMPLLWQHIPMEPIGKLVTINGHSSKNVHGRFAIADTALGNDAATLAEFGALRISHGFEPLEFEPLDDKDGGWRVKRFEIVEASFVSVPSNTDAVITAFSRGKLFHPLIKGWAGKAFESRETSVRVPAEAYERIFEKQETGCTCKGRKAAEMPMGVCPECGYEGEASEFRMDEKHAGPNRLKSGHVLFRKEFDVERQHVESATLEYDWISRFCSCEVKQLVNMGTFSARIRMGSFLTGLKHALEESTEVDARRLTYSGLESPLEYETIQLNSSKSDHFLVDGLSFRKTADGRCFVVKFNRTWNGEFVELFVAKKDAEAVGGLLGKAWEWANENNFLKGEAFSLGGEFLPRTGESWGDLFLDSTNEVEVKRTVDMLNSKGKRCPNRGQVFMGPPGTGKTLSGRLIRNHADATFIWIGGKDAYHFGGIGAVTSAFELAKELAPAVIFMEDIDASFDSRNSIDVLKTEMDGIGRSSGIITILTTNHPAAFPEALLDRPGRFHDVLKFGLPDQSIRGEMLRKWVPEITDKTLLRCVEQTDGYSGAHVYELCQYAKNLSESYECTIDDSLTKALKKIADQRDLINQELMGDRTLAGRRRNIEQQWYKASGIVTTKSAAEVMLKRGRAISAKNEQRMRDAIEDVQTVAGMEGVPRQAKTILNSAVAELESILEEVYPSEDMPQESSLGTPLSKQLEALAKLDIERAKEVCERFARTIEKQEQDDLLEALGI